MRFGAGILLLITSLASAQPTANKCTQTSALVKLIEKHHIAPPPVNDAWSVRVFSNFFDELDPLHLYFTQRDINTFAAQQHQLDNFVQDGKTCDWVKTVSVLLKRRLGDYKLWLDQSLGQSFGYTSRDAFNLADFPPKDFYSTEQELDTYRKSFLKFQILSRMYVGSVTDSSGKSLLAYEPVARKNIQKKELQKISDIERKGFEGYASECFLRAVALAYDPHTGYLSVEDKKEFDESLSDENISFGFSVEENETGSFVVTNIIPGGPAWNSNVIREGDFVLNAVVANRQINAMDYELEDFDAQINAASVSEAIFTFKKTDGRLTKIKLVKEKTRSIENTVSGYVLKGAKKIGYIPLPSFYFNHGQASGGAAGDVAKAILKLKSENIEGLILDLRFNGGGSIDEARDLAGIFIDFGPVIIEKQAKDVLNIIKDLHKGTLYTGPLIIMVNSFSASASELLAAALQDHRRAMIIGGRTYGKGTGQSVLPLPGSTSEFAKVTAFKMYRVTGKTFQHKGVIPDIELPDASRSIGLREADLKYALSSDSINKKAYYTRWALKPLDSLREKSKLRVASSDAFKNVESVRLKLLQPIQLNVDSFLQYTSRPKWIPENFKPLQVTNTTFDDSLLAMDAFRKTLNEKSIKEIQDSFYIQEAYNIMLDYITQP